MATFLDRKSPPSVDDAVIHPACAAAFTNARSHRAAHSFIGLTGLAPKLARPTFYMFPCFTNDPDSDDHAFSDSISNLASTGHTTMRSKWVRQRMRDTYGPGNVVFVNGINGAPDGRSHEACIELINRQHPLPDGKVLSDNDVIGWGIRPVLFNGQVGLWLVRFGSSRNLPDGGGGGIFKARPAAVQKEDETDQAFADRQANRAQRDPRDLPKAWAQWVMNVLAANLGVTQLSPFERTQAAGKLSKFTAMR